MKKTVILFVLGLCATAGVIAGNVKESSVPAVVKSYVTKNYPQVTMADWNYEKQGNYYTADFKINSMAYTVDISPKGEMINSTQEIADADIPMNIRADIGKQYPGFKITDAWKLNTKGKIWYKVAVNGQNTDQTLSYSSDGMLMKKK